MTTNPMQQETFDVLRHIEVHGPRTKAELAKGLSQAGTDVGKRVNNLLAMGYLSRDETTHPPCFALANKARAKLGGSNTSKAPADQADKKTRAKVDPTASLHARLRVKALTWTSTKRMGQAMAAPYSASEYHPSNRPGAMHAFTLPSRVGDQLRYRDGRVTDMAGNAVIE